MSSNIFSSVFIALFLTTEQFIHFLYDRFVDACSTVNVLGTTADAPEVEFEPFSDLISSLSSFL